MKQLQSETSRLIKQSFATNQFIDQLKEHKEVVHIWCSMVPTQSLALIVVHVNDTKKVKKLRKLVPVKDLLESNEAAFVFLDTETLAAHETDGTLFLTVHCKKEKLVYGADDFSFSWYTESKQHEVYRRRHASVTGFINGLIAPEATNFPEAGGYFYGKAVAYHVCTLEELALGTKYPHLSLRKRVLQLGFVLPFTKRFLLRDKDRLYLLDRMIGYNDEENYFLDNWWDATLELLSQLQGAVELVLDHMSAVQDRKPLPLLALPEYSATEPELKQLVSIISQEPRIEEMYLYHTREFLVAGPIKRHYFMIVFSTPESKLTGKEVRLLMETQMSEATFQCSFMVVSKIVAQRLLYFSQSFFKDKITDANCIYKKDPYAPHFHWERTTEETQEDLCSYYGSMEDALAELVLFFEENNTLPHALIVLPKTRMRNVLVLMFQAYAYKVLFYLDPYCDDVELFLGLVVFHSTEITGIWNRFNSTVLDLLPFFESESDVLADVEKVALIKGFYGELSAVIGTAYN